MPMVGRMKVLARASVGRLVRWSGGCQSHVRLMRWSGGCQSHVRLLALFWVVFTFAVHVVFAPSVVANNMVVIVIVIQTAAVVVVVYVLAVIVIVVPAGLVSQLTPSPEPGPKDTWSQ